MLRVVVLGADSLLGQHVGRQLARPSSPLGRVALRLWSFRKQQTNVVLDKENVRVFHGQDTLLDALANADVVVNCHEVRDWTVIPDVDLLRKHNINFVSTVLASISCPLVHISSVFVQCSHRWPNVFEPESQSNRYRAQWPFKAYCASKAEAEDLVTASGKNALILRTVPLYGEGDKSSILTDLIRVNQMTGFLPVIGDRGGVMQMAYAGNVAGAVLSAMDHVMKGEIRMETDDVPECIQKKRKGTFNVVIVGDESPKQDVYALYDALNKNAKRRQVSPPCPLAVFLLCFYFYSLVVFVLRAVNSLLPLPETIKQLPDPSVFYFYFYHWSLFNLMKSRLFLDSLDSFSHAESLDASSSHYKFLTHSDIPTFSWIPQE